MSKTLVISDNELLNQLYVINLEVYLATSVTITHSIQDAEVLIESDKFYDLIISLNMINGQESALEIFNYLDKNNFKIPLIIIGNNTDNISNFVVIPNSYNLQSLLSYSAKALGVTAKEMVALSLPEYFRVDIKFVITLEVSPCQIFLKIMKKSMEDSFVLIAKSGSLTKEVLDKFSTEGITDLYVNKNDRLKIVNQISQVICKSLNNVKGLGISDKSNAVEAVFEFAASDFFHSAEARETLVEIANACTKVMAEICFETPGLRSLLSLLSGNKSGYIYTHSMLTAFVASHIVNNVPWGGKGQFDKINFILFFHDIVLAPIYIKYPHLKYEEDLLFNGELTDTEKEIVLNHAKMAAEIVLTYQRAPLGADLLIKQHHGMTNGVGFAIDYKDDISPLSRIVLISESFVEEYLKGKDKDPNYVIDLKKIILFLSEKYSRKSYLKIINTLETIKL